MKYEQCLSCKNMISGNSTCLYPPPSCDGYKKYKLDIEKIYEPVKLIDKEDGFSFYAGPIYLLPPENEHNIIIRGIKVLIFYFKTYLRNLTK